MPVPGRRNGGRKAAEMSEGVGSGGQGVSDTQSERYGWRNEVTASRTRRSLTHYVAEGVASEARRQARDESNEMRDRRLAREPK